MYCHSVKRILPQWICAATILLLVCLAITPVAGQTTSRVRLMAANLTSGNNQSYDPGEGIRIFQGLKPDVVMIQEFKYKTSTATDIREMVTTAFDSTYSYYRESGAGIPNGVISRYPILDSGEWTDSEVSDRDFAWARIDIPGDKDLWVVSVHFLTTSSTKRNNQATLLIGYLQQYVPAGDYLVVGGDLNTSSRTESCVTTLGSRVTSPNPYPADQNGNPNTNANRNSPYDWILLSPGLHTLRTSVRVGSSTYANGLVFDSRVYTPLSEVAPVLVTDSGATNMQHMAVVVDLLVSVSTPTPSATPTATATPTASATVTQTVTPTPSPTASPTPSPTASPTPSPTPSASPSPPPSPTPETHSGTLWILTGASN